MPAIESFEQRGLLCIFAHLELLPVEKIDFIQKNLSDKSSDWFYFDIHQNVCVFQLCCVKSSTHQYICNRKINHVEFCQIKHVLCLALNEHRRAMAPTDKR